MGKLALVRIDSRLIHGQVVTHWIKRTSSRRCIIIDNDIAADEFLFQVYMMASPVGVKLEIYSAQQAGERWLDGEFGTLDPIIVLFKDVPMVYSAYKEGFVFPELQVGGIGGGHGRKNVVGPIALDDEDGKMLHEMAQNGMNIYFQPVPDNSRVGWDDVKKKHYPNL